MFECQLCGRECKSGGSLAKHLLYNHSEYTTQRYYDEFILTSPPTCVVCDAPIDKFINVTHGYQKTCGHVCGGKYHRRKLSADKEKHDKFIQKLSSNQEKVWAERENNGTAKAIREKIGNTITENNSRLTDEELSEKYGWMNKLTEEEKQKWIEEVMMNTGAHTWWREGDENEKREVVERRNATKLGISVEEYRNCDYIDDEREKYYHRVWLITERNYQKYKSDIDPLSLRSPRFHLDHKYSVVRGFYENIPEEIIGSRHNLEILSASDNGKKSGKCSINIEELMECYNGEVRTG